jgi:hypothetical protein
MNHDAFKMETTPVLLGISERHCFDPSQHKTILCLATDSTRIEYRVKASRIYLSRSVFRVLKRTFLPIGYPASVRKEYLEYQLWDSIQGLCSYLRSVLTTQSILIGAGVGRSDKTAMAAALVWIAKDGVGMVASLLFAYTYSDYFEVNVKEFRLLADFLNNVALICNLCVSLLPSRFLLLSCASATCSSLCGLIAGATKARISAHFAQGNHLADVTAKESTQETAVTLIGLVIGYITAKLIGEDILITWMIFLVLLCIHQIANYILVRVLILDTVNPQRCWILMRLCIPFDIDNGEVLEVADPETVARLETLSRPLWLAGYGPTLGVSLEIISGALNYMSSGKGDEFTLKTLLEAWHGHHFIIGFNCKGRVVICLSNECDEVDALRAYMLGLYIFNLSGQARYLYFNVSKPDLKRRYEQLCSQDLHEAVKWLGDNFPSNKTWATAGWDILGGKSRLGDNNWRYSPDYKEE